jgi:hypothetical protein
LLSEIIFLLDSGLEYPGSTILCSVGQKFLFDTHIDTYLTHVEGNPTGKLWVY